MEIRTVGNQGSVERAGDRSQKAEAGRAVVIPAPAPDRAEISQTGKATAAAVEGLADRARRAGGDREELVAAALRRLQSGELDGPEAVGGAARAMFDGGFRTV